MSCFLVPLLEPVGQRSADTNVEENVALKKMLTFLNNLYIRGLKLELIGGPHSKEKVLRGQQFIGEQAYAGRKLPEKL